MTIAWSAYRDPAARRAAAAGARRPPMPLDQEDAIEQAIELHRLGVSYRAISVIMGHYHGHWAPGPAWCARVNRATRRV